MAVHGFQNEPPGVLSHERRCCMDPRPRLANEVRSAQGGLIHHRKPAEPFKRRADHRHHIPKPRYRITNWRKYDVALRQRGSLTVWITDEVIAAWQAEPRTTPGGQRHYSTPAITTALTDHALDLSPGFAANRRAHWLRLRATRARTHRSGSFDDGPPERDTGPTSDSPVRNWTGAPSCGQHRP